jgi:YidC/Oxa1 family membrane protein insertase
VGNPLNALYEAVGWILTRIYDFLSPIFGASSGWTWALTIVILVVLMRLVMVPLFIKQMHTTRAMTSLQPQMAALRKKYKNDKQTLNQETMKLYQEAGVNPLMGCLPVVAQLPLFFSLFSVLRAIAEWKPGQVPKYHLSLQMVTSASHAKILGVSIADKFLFTDGLKVPLHAKAVILVAVLVSMVTTYLTVRQSMKRGMMPAATPDNPMGQSQKYMAYIMPFFALTGLYWPFGLVLYWVTTNVWTLIQQWVLFKRYPYTPPAAGDAAVATAGVAGVAGARSLTSGKPAKGAPARPAPKVTTTTKPSVKSGSKPSAAAAVTSGSSGSSGSPEPAAADSSDAAGSAAGSGSSGKPGTPAKSGSSAKSAKSGGAGGAAGQNGRASSAKTPANGASANNASANNASAGNAPANGASQAKAAAGSNGGGLMRKLGRGRAEQEEQAEPAEVKLVRQQRQRQSRSKRSGKH